MYSGEIKWRRYRNVVKCLVGKEEEEEEGWERLTHAKVCVCFVLFICFVAVKLSSSSSAEVLRPTSPRLLSTTTTTKARVIFTSIGAAGGGVRLELRPAGHLADDTLRVDLLLERVVELEAPTPRRQHRQRVLRLLLDGGLRAAAENHVQLLLGELKRPFLGHGDFFRI